MSLRPGSLEAQRLFESDFTDTTEWSKYLLSYPLAVAAVAGGKAKSELSSWDKFLWEDLETVAAARNPPHITLAELAEVMRWKLARGKARPLQKLLESNANAAVVKASTDALKHLKAGHWEKAIDALTTLKAVGVATASAVLAPFAPADVPFMADEVMEAVSCKRDYTMKIYKEMRTALIQKAKHLTILGGSNDGGGRAWTAEDLGKALWVRAMMVVYPALAVEVEKIAASASKGAGAGSGASASTGSTAGLENASGGQAVRGQWKRRAAAETVEEVAVIREGEEEVAGNSVGTVCAKRTRK